MPSRRKANEVSRQSLGKLYLNTQTGRLASVFLRFGLLLLIFSNLHIFSEGLDFCFDGSNEGTFLKSKYYKTLLGILFKKHYSIWQTMKIFSLCIGYRTWNDFNFFLNLSYYYIYSSVSFSRFNICRIIRRTWAYPNASSHCLPIFMKTTISS
jgi:hypothetical protein